MNILVTGANGQLGNEMRIVSRNTTDHYIFTDVNEVGGVETTYLDITDMDAIRRMVKENKVDAIVNCAAWTNVDACETDEKLASLAERLNAEAPQNLATVMQETGGWLIQISTDYVFGKEPYNTPCKPDQTGTPTGVYGKTKLHGEENIIAAMSNEQSAMSNEQSAMSNEQSAMSNEQSATSSSLKAHGSKRGGYIIIRTAWLYSEFGKNFCKTMLNLTATKPQLKVVYDQCGTPTYALDLAKAIVKILEEPKIGVYHYSNEGVCSWYDFTQMILKISNKLNAQYSKPIAQCDIQPCYSTEYPSPVKRPSYSVLDKHSIKETFGVEVPYWVDSLEQCISNIKGSEQ